METIQKYVPRWVAIVCLLWLFACIQMLIASNAKADMQAQINKKIVAENCVAEQAKLDEIKTLYSWDRQKIKELRYAKVDLQIEKDFFDEVDTTVYDQDIQAVKRTIQEHKELHSSILWDIAKCVASR